MSENKARLLRALVGGCIATALFFLVAVFLNSFSILGGSPSYAHMSFASHASIRRFGSHTMAVIMEVLSVFALGAAIGVATMPFAEEGRSLVRNSILHFLITGALVLLVGWTFCFFDLQSGWLLLLGLYTLLYLLIWLGRWIGWYVEIVQIRARLGLAPGISLGKWRETLPYLPLLLLICDLLPLLLHWFDRTFVVDVPVLSGLLLPFLIFPVVGFCSGLSLGKRQGLCPLYPLAALLLHLPAVFLLYNSSALFHSFILSGAALAGNITGTLYRKAVPKRSSERWRNPS